VVKLFNLGRFLGGPVRVCLKNTVFFALVGLRPLVLGICHDIIFLNKYLS